MGAQAQALCPSLVRTAFHIAVGSDISFLPGGVTEVREAVAASLLEQLYRARSQNITTPADRKPDT